jgi:hypothetical protein
MIPEVFLQIIVPARPFSAAFSLKLLEEAKMSHNSFARNILQGTSLFSIFYSATLPVNQRKQGFYAQSMGGGTRGASFAELSRPRYSAANLRFSGSSPARNRSLPVS